MELYKLWNAVKERTGKDPLDWANTHGHFEQWKNAKGYGDTDPEGKHWRSSQVWYKEYKDCPAGNAVRPTYQNIWHWLTGLVEFKNFESNTRRVIDLGFLLSFAKRKNGVDDEHLRRDCIIACNRVMEVASTCDIDPVDLEAMLRSYKEQYDNAIKLDWVIEILTVIRDIAGSDAIELEF